MLGLYKLTSKILHLIINLLFVVQIVLLILVFLTATYWFFDLINSPIFAFAAPIANAVSDFVKIFYNESIEVGGVYIDGTLLLFDIIALLLVFGISKSKFYIYNALENVDNLMNKCNVKIEQNFNKNLAKNAEEHIKTYSNVAFLVQFEAKNIYVNATWGGDPNEGVAERKEQAFETFFDAVKDLPGCRFAKTDDKMLILLNNFEKVDDFLMVFSKVVDGLREDMKKEKWQLLSYIAVDVFDSKTEFKEEVYPILEKLVALNHKNEAVCLSNFKARYDYKKNPSYAPFLVGMYNIKEEAQVWALVKKS